MKKRIFNIIYFVSFFSAILLMFYRMYLKNNGGEIFAEQLENVILGLMILAAFAKYADKIFPKWFKESNKISS